MRFRAVAFDFHGVLSRDLFYKRAFLGDDSEIEERINRMIFGDDHSMLDDWMRGRIGYSDVHKRVTAGTKTQPEVLDNALKESIRNMRLNAELLDFADSLRLHGVKTAIVTDNMDVFSRFTVPYHRLTERFDAIFNSADSGLLKRDNDGIVFEHVAQRLDTSFNEILFIDDTLDIVELFRAKGGYAHRFESCARLWADIA